MNIPSEDIVEMLEDESSLGLLLGTDLFIGFEPDNPNNTVTIFDTAGHSPQLTFDRTERYMYPSIQIRVRNISYQDGWQLINDIKNLLHGRAGETWNGTYYSLIYCSSDVGFLDWDNNKRARFVVNFALQRY